MRIEDDAYFTSQELVDIVMGLFSGLEFEISEYIEPSAGSGVFLDYFDKPYKAYDIEPMDERVIREDFLELDLHYLEGRAVVGNPPYGRCLSLAQKFFRKAVGISDYIAFILPISQLNNINSFYEFDLVLSEDLGVWDYSGRELHCCFNVYSRPIEGLNKKKVSKLEDVTIVRQDSKSYPYIEDYDLRMSYWGDGSAGKILGEGEHYSGEYKIIINNSSLRDPIKNFLESFDWKNHMKCIAMRKIQQFHIIDILRDNIENIK